MFGLEFVDDLIHTLIHYVMFIISKDQMEHKKELKKRTKFINYSKRDCAICCNKLVGEVYKTPCCNQDIHLHCYESCGNMVSNTCPYCRTVVKRNTSKDLIKQFKNSDILDNIPETKHIKYNSGFMYDLLSPYIEG